MADTEFEHRFRAARQQYRAVESDLREIYSYVFNGREREFDPVRKQWSDAEEIYDSTAQEATIEFGSDLFSFMTPENQKWVEYEIGTAVSEDLLDEVTEAVTNYEGHLDRAIRSSSYYDRGLEIFQDFAPGTAAMWVDRPSLNDPIRVEPVPLPELRLSAGVNGLEDRFRQKRVWARELPLLFPGAAFSRKMREKIAKPGTIATVIWGYWRDYSDPANPIWRHSAKADGEMVVEDRSLGPDGTCPLLVGRFNPVPGLPYGRGPGWFMLPEIRTLDAVRRMVLEKMDQSIDPAMIYVRDGLLDLSEGIEAGMAYPAMPGTAQETRAIGTEGNIDYGLFSIEELREIVRRGFFRKPQQPGKTPPSASQFVGEEQSEIRRMMRPAAPVFRELVVPFIKRVERLEVEAGVLPGQLVVQGRVISIRPVNPLMRAQSREKVMAAQSIMETAGAIFGEQTALLIDGPTTMRNIKQELGDELVRFRSDQELREMIQRAELTGDVSQ